MLLAGSETTSSSGSANYSGSSGLTLADWIAIAVSALGVVVAIYYGHKTLKYMEEAHNRNIGPTFGGAFGYFIHGRVVSPQSY